MKSSPNIVEPDMEPRKPSTSEILEQARRHGATKSPQKIEPPIEEPNPLPPLIAAAKKGELEMLISELAAGAPIDQTDAIGKTSLCYALDEPHLHAAHYLVDAGADVECINADMPPLLDAIASDDCSLVEKMLDRGADIRRQSREYGYSALMMAKTEEMIALLVTRGASFTARNKAGFDAIEECRFQAAAIRRHEEEKVQYYARLSEASSYDPALRDKLMAGLSEMSEERNAQEYDQLAAILERHRR